MKLWVFLLIFAFLARERILTVCNCQFWPENITEHKDPYFLFYSL